MTEVRFQVVDMDGPASGKAIKNKLTDLHGVSTASVDFYSKEVTVLLAYPQLRRWVYCAVENLGFHIAGR